MAAVVDCPGRHGLGVTVGAAEEGYCDLCFRTCFTCTLALGCRECDFLACTECHSNGGAVDVVRDQFMAARAGDVSTIRKLVGEGADLGAKSNERWTALVDAALGVSGLPRVHPRLCRV